MIITLTDSSPLEAIIFILNIDISLLNLIDAATS
jgi:hypothetical protein